MGPRFDQGSRFGPNDGSSRPHPRSRSVYQLDDDPSVVVEQADRPNDAWGGNLVTRRLGGLGGFRSSTVEAACGIRRRGGFLDVLPFLGNPRPVQTTRSRRSARCRSSIANPSQSGRAQLGRWLLPGGGQVDTCRSKGGDRGLRPPVFPCPLVRACVYQGTQTHQEAQTRTTLGTAGRLAAGRPGGDAETYGDPENPLQPVPARPRKCGTLPGAQWARGSAGCR